MSLPSPSVASSSVHSRTAPVDVDRDDRAVRVPVLRVQARRHPPGGAEVPPAAVDQHPAGVRRGCVPRDRELEQRAGVGVGRQEHVDARAECGDRARVPERADGAEARADDLVVPRGRLAVLAPQPVAHELVGVGEHVQVRAVASDGDLAGAFPVLADDAGVVVRGDQVALRVALVDLGHLAQLGARQGEPVALRAAAASPSAWWGKATSRGW